jgi:hypothetical protein
MQPGEARTLAMEMSGVGGQPDGATGSQGSAAMALPDGMATGVVDGPGVAGEQAFGMELTLRAGQRPTEIAARGVMGERTSMADWARMPAADGLDANPEEGMDGSGQATARQDPAGGEASQGDALLVKDGEAAASRQRATPTEGSMPVRVASHGPGRTGAAANQGSPVIGATGGQWPNGQAQAGRQDQGRQDQGQQDQGQQESGNFVLEASRQRLAGNGADAALSATRGVGSQGAPATGGQLAGGGAVSQTPARTASTTLDPLSAGRAREFQMEPGPMPTGATRSLLVRLPAELRGEAVQLRFLQRGDQIDVRIASTSESAAQELREQLPALVGRLQQAGMVTERASTLQPGGEAHDLLRRGDGQPGEARQHQQQSSDDQAEHRQPRDAESRPGSSSRRSSADSRFASLLGNSSLSLATNRQPISVQEGELS